MRRIEIDDNPPPQPVAFGMTWVRCVIGALLVAHGTKRVLEHAAFTAAVGRFFSEQQIDIDGVDLSALAYVLTGAELLTGLGLVLGWLTRLSSFALICASSLALALQCVRPDAWLVASRLELARFELPILLLSAGLLFFFAGGGPISVDKALRERAKRNAILNDAIWQRPPYVKPVREAWISDDDTLRTVLPRGARQR